MRFPLAIVMILFISHAFFAQENVAINDLLIEANSKLYKYPEQADRIATYIISQGESNTTQAKATLLLAKSFYVRGVYNDAVKNAMNAKTLADATNDNALRFETNDFYLKLSRDLGLHTVANKILDELISIQEKIKDDNIATILEGIRKQDRALVQFQNGNFAQAIKFLTEANLIYANTSDSISKNETELGITELFLQIGQLDSVAIHLAKLKKKSKSDFEKLQLLDIEGRLFFEKKEYQKSIALFQEELALSLALPNKIYENKSLDGLTVSYLAIEDTKNFYSYKQQNNLVLTEIETDKNLAVNSVYNYINSHQEEISDKRIQKSYLSIYILIGLILILFIAGLFVNYLYISKTKEYLALYKYISPRKIVALDKPKTEVLEKSSIVPEETEQILLHKLNKFESGKRYTNPDMSIALLASQFDTNTKYLSEVINRQKGKNFNSYINELRINYIIERLKTDPIYFTYKISYLAEESGFSSHSSFTTVFKSVTGISPTKFMDFLKQRQETA